MTRSDTLRAIAAYCRTSHAAALLAVGYLTLEEPTEVLEGLLAALSDQDGTRELLSHLQVLEAMMIERYGSSSRLG